MSLNRWNRVKCSTSTHLFTLVRLHSMPWLPFSLSVGYLVFVNGIHQWLVIRWWTTMFDLDTFIRIVGHVLVAVCVEDLPGWWHSIYATSLIVPVFMRFHPSWSLFQTLVYIWYLHPLWRYWSIVYCMWWFHTWQFVYHSYPWPLYSYVSGTTTCICSHMQIFIILSYWWVDGSST